MRFVDRFAVIFVFVLVMSVLQAGGAKVVLKAVGTYKIPAVDTGGEALGARRLLAVAAHRDAAVAEARVAVWASADAVLTDAAITALTSTTVFRNDGLPAVRAGLAVPLIEADVG